MQNDHHFAIGVEWIGNRGTGTSGYREYGRDVVVTADGKPDIAGSSARLFHGDAARWKRFFERHPFLSIHYVIDREGRIAASVPGEGVPSSPTVQFSSMRSMIRGSRTFPSS